MTERTTSQHIIGILETISKMTSLTFVLDGKNVYNTTEGSHSKYVYGETKTILHGKLQAILEHIYAIKRLN